MIRATEQRQTPRSKGKALEKNGRHTGWNDNDENEDDDAGNQAHAHLDVLPPHLLADAVGAPTEALS